MSPKNSDHPESTGDSAESSGESVSPEADLKRARAEFAATLDEIEDRLNPRIQARRATASIKRRVSKDPAVLGAAAAGAAALAAAIASVAKIASRKR